MSTAGPDIPRANATEAGPSHETPAAIRIEFYGIPRERAGVDALDVEAATLGAALAAAGRSLPGFGDACLDGPRLRPGYLASINGTHFTTDPAADLAVGDTVLVFSADVGG